MEQFLNFLRLVLGTLGSPIKLMFVLVFLTGSALFLPAAWQRSIGTYDWTHSPSHLATEWIVFLFCSLYLLLSGIEIEGRHWARTRHLKNLASDEQLVLSQFYALNSCTCAFMPGDTGIHSLMKDGILEQAKDSHEFFKQKGQGAFYYSISPKTLRYLKKHPRLVTHPR